MKEKEQIINLVTGNIAGNQKNDVLKKVKNDPELRKEYRSIKNAWALSSKNADVTEINIEKSYLNLKTRITKQSDTISRRLYSVLKYAAVLLIAFWIGSYSDTIRNFLTGNADGNDQTEIIVPPGQISEVRLPDGSLVWLNSETKLLLPAGFSKRTRNVNLEGEAYFEVRKGKKRFVVSTKSGDITVLGTSFNVSAFNDSEFQTTLEEGIIQFKSRLSNEKITLLPGQQLFFLGKNIKIQEVETNKYTSWRKGIIVFDKEPFRSVIKKLERRFAVKIQMEDVQLGEIRFTGSIENESLPEVMSYINKTMPVQYTYDKKQKLLKIKPMQTK